MPPGFLQGVVFTIWVAYVVTKDLGIPLVRSINDRKKAKSETPPPKPSECPYIEPLKTRVIALELNFTQQTARLADLGELFKEERKSMEDASVMSDNKLDMVLAELKEFRESIETRLGNVTERLAVTETNVGHLLVNQQMKGRRGGD